MATDLNFLRINIIMIIGEIEMKKILLTLIAVIIAVGFSSCTVRNDTSPVYVETTKIYNRFYTLGTSQWVKAEKANSWYVSLQIPEITPSIIDYGAVIIYVKDEFNAWVPLPRTKVFKTSAGVAFSEEISASYSSGRVDIDYKYDDPADPTPPHSPVNIKVTILDDNHYYYDMIRVKNANELEDLKIKYNVEEINLNTGDEFFLRK